MIHWHLVFDASEQSSTGLFWKEKPKNCRSKEAGSKKVRSSGKPKAIEVMYKGKIYSVHRIIWEMLYGTIDKELVIDHIDGNPWNNNINNLRLVTQKVNCQNRKKRATNSSGYTGVCWINNGAYAKAEIQTKDGSNIQKTFSVKKNGLLLAFLLACQWRREMLIHLNTEGESYSENHGG